MGSIDRQGARTRGVLGCLGGEVHENAAQPHLLKRMEGGIAIPVYLKPVAFAVSSVGLLHAAYSFNFHGGPLSSSSHSVSASVPVSPRTLAGPSNQNREPPRIPELEKPQKHLEHPFFVTFRGQHRIPAAFFESQRLFCCVGCTSIQ